jgi:hypothetical protein
LVILASGFGVKRMVGSGARLLQVEVCVQAQVYPISLLSF